MNLQNLAPYENVWDGQRYIIWQPWNTVQCGNLQAISQVEISDIQANYTQVVGGTDVREAVPELPDDGVNDTLTFIVPEDLAPGVYGFNIQATITCPNGESNRVETRRVITVSSP